MYIKNNNPISPGMYCNSIMHKVFLTSGVNISEESAGRIKKSKRKEGRLTSLRGNVCPGTYDYKVSNHVGNTSHRSMLW